VRKEIKDFGRSDRQAAQVVNITRATARKWIKRDDVQDRSHRTAHNVECGARGCRPDATPVTLPALDGLLFLRRQYINADAPRYGIACPRPHDEGLPPRRHRIPRKYKFAFASA